MADVFASLFPNTPASQVNSGLGDIGGAIGSFGSAFGDFAQQGSDLQSANAYSEAADIAAQNKQITEMSTNVQEISAARRIKATLAKQQSQLSGAGVDAGEGSGLDLLMEGTRQGYLTQQMIGVQGQINANAYQAQETQAMAESSAAKSAAGSAEIGGITSILGGAVKAASGIAMLG